MRFFIKGNIMTNTVSAQVSATLPEKGTFSGKTLFTKFLILIDKICRFIGSTFQYLSSMVSFSKKDFNPSLKSAEISLVESPTELDKNEPKINLSPKTPSSKNANRLDKVVCRLNPIPKPVSVEKLPELDEKEPNPKKELEKPPTKKKEDICEELDSNPKTPKEDTEKEEAQTSLLLNILGFIGSASILKSSFTSQANPFKSGHSPESTAPLFPSSPKTLLENTKKILENITSEDLGTCAAETLNTTSIANPIPEFIDSEDSSYLPLSASTISFGVLAALSLALISYKVFSSKKESEKELDLEKTITAPNLQPSAIEPPKQKSLYPDLSVTNNNNRTAPICTGQYAPSAPDFENEYAPSLPNRPCFGILSGAERNANLPSAPSSVKHIPPTQVNTNLFQRKCVSINDPDPNGIITPIQELKPLKKTCIYPKKVYSYLKNSCISREKAYSYLKTAAHYLSYQEVYIPLVTTAAVSSLIGVKNTFKLMYWTGVGISYIPRGLYLCYQYPIIPIAAGATSFGVFHALFNREESLKKAY